MNDTHKAFFTKLLGKENARFDEAYKQAYSYDATKKCFLPDGVLFPRDESDIQKILSYCNEHLLIITPRGLGSGFSGGALACKGGLIISFDKHMNKIIKLDLDNLIIRVQPGIRNQELQDYLKPFNLFYPPDPASMAHSSLGGNVSENAGGMRAAKYGITKDYVMSIRAVLPNGSVIKAGKETIKDVAGLNILGTLIGSEGVLAVFSELTLKLCVLPKYKQTIMGIFPSIDLAMQAVCKSFLCGIKPVSMEFLDNLSIKTIEKKFALGLDIKAGAILIASVDASTKQTLEYELDIISKNFLKFSAKIKKANNEEEELSLWKARRCCSQAIATLGEVKLNEDITVPRSKLPKLLAGIKEISNKYGFLIPCFGHAGDGNVHCNIMLPDKNDKEALKQGKKSVEELFKLSISLGGTLSGEHGIGLAKADYMHLAFTKAELNLMRQIKLAFDPNNILNPYKMGL